MPKITFITSDGKELTFDSQAERSVMEVAVENEVPGIDADCGGCCSCATCHVYVEPDWIERLGEAGDMESDMLAVMDERKAGSRLSCQIQTREELDGLVVRIPEFQW